MLAKAEVVERRDVLYKIKSVGGTSNFVAIGVLMNLGERGCPSKRSPSCYCAIALWWRAVHHRVRRSSVSCQWTLVSAKDEAAPSQYCGVKATSTTAFRIQCRHSK